MTQRTSALEKAMNKSLKYTGEEVVVYQDFWSNFKVMFYEEYTEEMGDVVALFLDGKMIG